jgi:copper resistance protein B
MRCTNTILVALLAICASVSAWGHDDATPSSDAAPFGSPVDDERVYVHALLEQFEYRAASSDNLSRWEGEAWVGTDKNRLWLRSEGEVDRHGVVKDGQTELFFDRPITSFFDLQTGVRYDLDSAPGRAWAAFGVEGLAPYFLRLAATVYASDSGHFAAKAQGSYDLLLTQRLILQPQIEVNAYTAPDERRRQGSGISDLDAGLRLRYEFSRKFAPYLGVAYKRVFAQTATYARADGDSVGDLNVLIGVRAWF